MLVQNQCCFEQKIEGDFCTQGMGIAISISRNSLQIHPMFRTHAWTTVKSCYVNSWSNSTLLLLVKMLNSPKRNQKANKQKISERFGLFFIDVHTQKQLILSFVPPIFKYRFWAKDNLVKKDWRQIPGIPLAISFRLSVNQSFWKACMISFAWGNFWVIICILRTNLEGL